MNESKWLKGCDPDPMLGHLLGYGRGDDSVMRLWICACCRLWPKMLMQDGCLAAVKAGERFADSGINEMAGTGASNRWLASYAVQSPCNPMAFAISIPSRNKKVAAALLREVAGNPFRRPVWANRMVYVPVEDKREATAMTLTDFRLVMAESRVDWYTRDVKSLAIGMKQEWRWDDVGVLADALEEAGAPVEWGKHFRRMARCGRCLGEGCGWCEDGWVDKECACVRGCYYLESLVRGA